MEKVLRLSDKLKTKDNYKKQNFLNGAVRITDAETGEVILKKKNIIVLRGRAFALEKLFNDPIPPNFQPASVTALNSETIVNPYIANLNRTVCLFNLGSGGASKANPFIANTPSPNSRAMSERVPFRIVDLNDPNNETYPALTAEESKMYYNKEIIDGKAYYYSKVFDSEPKWMNKEDASNILTDAGVDSAASIIADNEVFKYIVLKISAKDCREYNINELGLQIAEKDEVTGEYKDIEQFSHITFPTEHLAGTKKLLIEYFLFS